jgi:hypothetical protein
MKFKVDIEVNIEAIYNTETEEFQIISCKPHIYKKEDVDDEEYLIHLLSKTQYNFGILTLGAKSVVGRQLPPNETVTIKFFEGKKEIDERTIRTHKTVKGRLDGLTSFYASNPDINENTEFKIKYISDTKTLEIYMI